MSSHVWMSFFYVSTFLGITSCLGAASTFHAGHEAEHQQVLWKRSRPDRYNEQSAHEQQMMNISTKLEDFGTEYIGTIGVGTNKEGKAQFQARVVFDTGSTNLWVASTLCTGGPCSSARGKEFYDPSKSSTQMLFEGTSEKAAPKGDIDITFGTGELVGPLHVDHMYAGPMVVKQQPFAMIRTMTGSVFSSFPFEGILGLGFRSLSFGGIEPFFEHVIAQKLLKNNEFAFFMNVDSDKPSALLWGGVDPDLYHGQIKMFPVIQPHYWALDLVDFKLGNTSMRSAAGGNPVKRLIVDTGTTYFTAPTELNSLLQDKMSEAGYPPMTYVLKDDNGETYDLVVTKDTYTMGGDSPAFMALDVNEKYGPAMLLGEVFMKHFFTVFSRGDGKDENAKVGFAPAKTDATPKVQTFALQQQQQTVVQSPASGSQFMALDSKARAESIVRRDIKAHV